MTSTERHLSPRAVGAGRVLGRRLVDEEDVGQGSCVRGIDQMLVAEGAGRWICWILFVWGIVTGCPLGPGLAHGAESAWCCPLLQAALHAIREPQSRARAAPAAPGLPRLLGRVQQWPAPPSTSPSPWFPDLGPGVALTEAPSRQHKLSDGWAFQKRLGSWQQIWASRPISPSPRRRGGGLPQAL